MRAIVWGLAMLAAAGARAQVPGGGLADVDCRVTFEGVTATAGASGVGCADGDPGCDGDGARDGACRFAVRVCVGSGSAGCPTTPLARVDVAGLALPVPEPPDDGVCAEAVAVAVPAGTAAGATVIARQGTELRDVDYLNLCCADTADALAGVRCALGVDLAVTGCASRLIPKRARAAYAAAGRLLPRAGGGDPRSMRRAVRRMEVVRQAGRRLAPRDPCGNALALVASHAVDVLRSAAAP